MTKPEECRCCGGARTVLDAMGEPRPCSRCSVAEFVEWLRQRAVRSEQTPEPK